MTPERPGRSVEGADTSVAGTSEGVAPVPPAPRRLALAGAFVAGLAGGLVGAALSRGRSSREC